MLALCVKPKARRKFKLCPKYRRTCVTCQSQSSVCQIFGSLCTNALGKCCKSLKPCGSPSLELRTRSQRYFCLPHASAPRSPAHSELLKVPQSMICQSVQHPFSTVACRPCYRPLGGHDVPLLTRIRTSILRFPVITDGPSPECRSCSDSDSFLLFL